MTVDEYAEALARGELEFVEESYYINRSGRTGYGATYRDSQACYWYRVSGSEVPFAPDEVARAIRDPGREIWRENAYFNRNVQQGFEATVRAGGHWFMLNAAPDPPSF